MLLPVKTILLPLLFYYANLVFLSRPTAAFVTELKQGFLVLMKIVGSEVSQLNVICFL